jgi:hypothetical protein
MNVLRNLLIITIIFIPICVFGNFYSVDLSESNIILKISKKQLSNFKSLHNYYNKINDNFILTFVYDGNLPKINTLNDYIKVQNSGIIRKLNTFQLLINKNYIENSDSIIKIEIKFPFNYKLNYQYDKLKDIAYFENVINKEHIIFLKEKVNILADKLLENNNWINYNLEYLKFYTKQDGIGIITGNDILKIQPNWENINLQNLILYQRGQEIPIYIVDKNYKLDVNDTIIFLSSRAFGDTTYYENYTNNEAFFLTYEPMKIGKRFELFEENNNPIDFTDKIYIEKHIEREVEYSTGSLFIRNYFENKVEQSNHFDTRTVMGEGWFWKILFPKKKWYENDNYKSEKFNNIININSVDNENISVKMFYQSAQDSINADTKYTDRETKFKLKYEINGLSQKEKVFNGFLKDSLELIIEPNKILDGNNLIKVTSEEIDPANTERILIDYFKLTGFVKPIAENGILNFYNKEEKIVILSTYNFKSPNAILIDKTNNKIINTNKIESIKGHLIRISANSFDTNFVSLGINDSIVSAYGNGLHFFINPAPDYKKFIYLNSNNNEAQIVQEIQKLNKGSVILIAASGNNKVSVLNNELIKLGVKANLSNLNGNWIFGKIIGSDLSYEKFETNNLVKLSVFEENDFGNSYNLKFKINLNSNSEIIIVDDKSLEKPILEIAKFDKLNENSDIDAIFITHKNFFDATLKLKKYREASQNLKIKLIDVESIYNEFNYGNESPHAIKNYLKNLYNYSKNFPRYLLLFGDANWDARNLLSKSISKNFLPVYGNPVSDWWYCLLDGDNDFAPDIIAGRIPCNTINEAYAVVDKLIEYDTLSPEKWMKNFLFLTGGLDSQERNRFYMMVRNYYEDIIINNTVCGTIDYVRKKENLPSASSQGTEIREKINNGALWTIYLGHAASEIFELDGWNANSLNNKGRYGILATISCNTGAFAEPNLINCRNEEYLKVPDKGYIGVLGSTTLGFVFEHNYIVYSAMELLLDSSKKQRNLGEIFNYGKSKLSPISFQLFTLYHFSLLGDPTTRIRFGTNTDAYFIKESIKLITENNSEQPVEDDNYVYIQGKFNNYGYNKDTVYYLYLIREWKNLTDTLKISFNSICNEQIFNFKLDINKKAGLHKLKIIIDPENFLNDSNQTNNIYFYNFEVFTAGLSKLEPQENWNVDANKPIFRVLNPIGNNNDYDYFFEIIDDDNNNRIYEANTIDNNIPEIKITNEYIDWKPNLTLIDNKHYILKAKYISKSNGKISEWLIIPFYASNYEIKNNLIEKINIKNYNFAIKENLIEKKSKDLEQLSISYKEIPFYSLGVRGIRDSNFNWKVNPYSHIEVGNKVFVQGFHDRGFNVVVFSANEDGINTKYRLFDTWGKDESHPEENWYKDSVSVELVRFIRDSVKNDDYLLIATSNSCFRLPVYFKIFAKEPCEGSIDTLFSELRKFGSLIADTTIFDENNQGFETSFAMMGYRGAPIGTIPEAIHFNGDSAQISGKLYVYKNNGYFRTKPIGKAKQWKNLKLNTNLDTNYVDFIIKIYHIKDNGNVNLLKEIKNQSLIDLNFLNLIYTQRIIVESYFERKDTSIVGFLKQKDYGLSSIFVEYIPADEVAIVEDITNYSKNGILRGEETELNIGIKNLSLRNSIDSVFLLTSFTNDNGFRRDFVYNFNNINQDETVIKKIKIETSDFLRNTNTEINVNYNNQFPENYLYNNKTKRLLTIKPDTVKPYVILKIDDKIHKDYDYISIQPVFTVELYDNSPLKILDSNSITVRVNGYLHPYQRTKYSKFESFVNEGNLKAKFTFIPDSLEFEDVSIIVYYNDAEGNKDTLRTFAKLSLYNAYIENSEIYPNPAYDKLNIKFNYIAPNSNAEAKIDIFDINGKFLNTFYKKIFIGENIINFFTNDFYKNSLSSNLFFYKISIISEFYTEPKFGKFILIK